MIGEAEARAVAADEPPAMAQRRRAAVEMGGEVFGGWCAWALSFASPRSGERRRYGDDLDERDLRDRARLEGREVDVELVRIEADRHVERKPGRDDRAGRRGG